MNNENNRELTMEELDQITAGYPGTLPDLSQYDEVVEDKQVDEVPEIFITENERLVNDLPFGELSEEDLDNVMAGRTR